jgi:chromosome segregation ATPase
MATGRKRGKKKVGKSKKTVVKVKKKAGFFSFFRSKKKTVAKKKPVKAVKLELKVDNIRKDLKVVSALGDSFDKRLSGLKSSFDKHERLGNETVDMLMERIKRKKPVKLDKLENSVKDMAKDLRLVNSLNSSFNKLSAGFVKFKKDTDEEFEEIIDELKKYNLKKIDSKIASLAAKVSSKSIPVPIPTKDIDKMKEKISIVSSWYKELNKSLGLVDSNLRLLVKDFEKHKDSAKKLKNDFEDDVKMINAKLKAKLPPPPVSPGVEKRLEKVEDEISEIVDIAESSKDVADSSRTFMNEVESQLVALTKMLEEYKAARVEVEANVHNKLEGFSGELNELKDGFAKLSNSINDVGYKVDNILNLSSDVDVVKNKIARLEKAGFGALIIE